MERTSPSARSPAVRMPSSWITPVSPDQIRPRMDRLFAKQNRTATECDCAHTCIVTKRKYGCTCSTFVPDGEGTCALYYGITSTQCEAAGGRSYTCGRYAEKKGWHGSTNPPPTTLVRSAAPPPPARLSAAHGGDWLFFAHHKTGTTVGLTLVEALCGSRRPVVVHTYRERPPDSEWAALQPPTCHFFLKIYDEDLTGWLDHLWRRCATTVP